MEEYQLIDLLKKQDRLAFRQLVQTYQDKVYNTCMGFVRHEQDAEDIAQEVFIEVFHSVTKFREESKLSTWIYRITVSKSLEFIRKKKSKKRTAFLQSLFGLSQEVIYSDYVHPGIQMENRERAKILFEAIGKLPENQKIAFTLHKVEALSYQEIAQIMDTSLSSVEALMHRARKKLQKLLAVFYKNEKNH